MLRIASNLTINTSKQAPCVLHGTFIVATNNGDQTKSSFSSGSQNLQARRPGHDREKRDKKNYDKATKFGLPFAGVAALAGIGYHQKSKDLMREKFEKNEEAKEIAPEDMVTSSRHPLMPLQEFKMGQPERTWVAFEEGKKIKDLKDFSKLTSKPVVENKDSQSSKNGVQGKGLHLKMESRVYDSEHRRNDEDTLSD